MAATSAGTEPGPSRVSHPVADTTSPPFAGATHGARAAAVAGLSRAERPGRGCSRDVDAAAISRPRPAEQELLPDKI